MIGVAPGPEPWAALQLGVLLLVLALCGLTDLVTGRIPNVLTAPAAVLGLALSPFLGGWTGLGSSLLGLLAGLGLFGVVWAAGGIGGGDVKLMAAVGALRGVSFVLSAAVLAVLAGGVLAVAFATYHGRLIRSVRSVLRTCLTFLAPHLAAEPPVPEESVPLPFGFAICLGSAWLLLA